ncbi:MAG: DUF1501 domain-containing protein [Planctomycetota bacterium]|nr:MAG: DUF1501 domain-containing protein [Planctomycetota bacterium]
MPELPQNQLWRPSRRQILLRAAHGFGALAFAAMQPGLLSAASNGRFSTRKKVAKHVIFLYMDGGISQVDSFDYKPRLEKEAGNPIKMEIPKTQFDDVGAVLPSPWKFQHYGECGMHISDLFPHIGSCADDLALIRSMTSAFPEHTNANYFLHTGSGLQGRPSMGAWWTYGMGSDSEDLPGFVVLNGGLVPPGGLDNFSNGFLPASYQASLFSNGAEPVPNLKPKEKTPEQQRRKLDLLEALDQGLLGQILPEDDAVRSAMQNYETAYRMQSAVPELMDIAGESEAVRKLYGLEAEFEHTRTYGALCLMARRLVQRGVRFIEITCPHIPGNDRWDQHSNLRKGHGENAKAVDQPIAGLLKDLKGLGLLDEVLVVFAGEFGRTPMAQGTNGRDHNPHGYSIWLAGGGAKGGTIIGSTDEYGYYAIEDPWEIHDLHATMLALMGVDHTRLTYRFDSRDMRLTDVKGHVIEAAIA